MSKSNKKVKKLTTIALVFILIIAAVVAYFTIGIYKITFTDEDGDILDSAIYIGGTEIFVPDAPEKEGYTFVGWEPELVLTAEQNVTYTPVYEKKIEITFKDKDGNVLSNTIYDKGSTINVPTAPILEGFKFNRWNPTISMEAINDAIYQAIYDKLPKVVFYDYDETVISSNYYETGATLIVPNDPTRSGYTFTGWDKGLVTTVTTDASYTATYVENDEDISDTISFHILDLETGRNGDSIYIKAGDTDILIDGGAIQASAAVIEDYVDQYCTDKVLEYVICTHADTDHIAAFVGTTTVTGLFDYYTCETIIDFPLTNKTTQIYNNYIQKRNAAVSRGSVRYSALECYNEVNGAQRVYDIGEGLQMEILYNYYYEHTTSDENNYSVCVLFKDIYNEKYFLFTGDLEKAGEQKLVQAYDLPEVELFKAGHHGSPTSSNDVLLSEINPKICVVSCSAGRDEYTKNIDNIFPSTDFINRISKYTDQVYCTMQYVNGDYAPLNGTVIVTSVNGEVSVNCTNNNTILKNSTWFNSSVDYYMNGSDYMLWNGSNTKEGSRVWRQWPDNE